MIIEKKMTNKSSIPKSKKYQDHLHFWTCKTNPEHCHWFLWVLLVKHLERFSGWPCVHHLQKITKKKKKEIFQNDLAHQQASSVSQKDQWWPSKVLWGTTDNKPAQFTEWTKWEKDSFIRQDPVSTMQKTGWTNHSAFLVLSGLKKGYHFGCDH